MKKMIVVMCLAAGVAFAGFALPSDAAIKSAASSLGVPFSDLKKFVQSYEVQSTPAGTVKIDSAVLCAEYLDNELKADKKYKGKTIQVTGVVEEVKNDYDGYYAQLKGASKGYLPYTINVYFADSALDRLSNVEKGQEISAIGTCEGKSMFSFVIKNAKFAK
jgi:hypothetical protein